MKLKLLFILILLAVTNTRAQNFYDQSAIQEIRIYFDDPAWEASLTQQYLTTQDYIMAETVIINDVTYLGNVGVKYKGNSTFQQGQVKNPLHLELDTYIEGQHYQGFSDIKLGNIFYDPTAIREVLSYEMLRQYMPAPRANYAKVWVNDDFRGFYVNVESVSKKFVSRHYNSNSNAFFDCNPINGAMNVVSPQEWPSLRYWGNDPLSYAQAYKMKSETGWEELISLINTLNNDTVNIESVLNVDRVLWYLAFNNVVANFDSYIGIFYQNYYLYRDDSGRFNPITWDMNMSFGTFRHAPAYLSDTALKQFDPMASANNANYPLISRLLSIPKYKKMYLAHFKTIFQENFANNSYLAKAQQLQGVIAGAVEEDPYMHNSYVDFSLNMNIPVPTNMGLIAPGITDLVNGRIAYLSGLPELNAAGPDIQSIVPSDFAPPVGSQITVRTYTLNANPDGVFLYYRNSPNAAFTKTQMFDDGMHDDGFAGDDKYGAFVTITSPQMHAYIYAENNEAGAFRPARAAYEYQAIYAVFPQIAPGVLVVNELMAQNNTTVTDPNGQYEDWIEFYNNSANTISLDNVYLSDTFANRLKWQFPNGTTIAPYGYLIVWADEDQDEPGLHANFKLSAAAESVFVSYPDATLLDYADFGQQVTDMGFARVPNGTGNFVIQQPTFNGNNEQLSVPDIGTTENVRLWPNPARDHLDIISKANIDSLEVFNLIGQKVYSQSCDGSDVRINTNDWQSGAYVVKIRLGQDWTTLKFIRQ